MQGVRVNGKPETNPVEDLNLLEQFSSEFTRINEKRIRDDEEVRYDIPNDLTNGNIYIGVSEDDTATSATSWTIVRYYFDANKKPNRSRIRFDVAWDDRTIGW